MTQFSDDDRQWQEFLRQYRSTPPPAKADLEEQLMNAVEKSQQPSASRRLWTVPPVIAASLLMAWSGYRTLIPFPELSSRASLEAFLENNWSSVVGETSTYSQSNSVQADWMLYAKTTP